MEKQLTAINPITGQTYTLGKKDIADAVTRLNAERGVEPGDTIKVAFLDTAPDYAIASVETYWAKYFPQIDPNTAHPSWAIRITKEYNEAKQIQTTFKEVPTAQRQAIFDQAIKLWQDTYANVNFKLITDPAEINQANVRIGLSSTVSQNLAPGALPESERAKLGDVYLNLSLAESSSGLLGAHALTTMFHEFGHVLGLSHGDDERQLPVEYGAMQFGVMGARADVRRSFKPVTPLLFDALGLEHMNLLNTNKNETDNYTIAPGTGRLIIDSGTTEDTLNGSAFDDEIDLRATDFAAGKAYFSSIGMSSPNRYNVAIYEGTKIENATGGEGHDKLIGNDLANVLDGGQGNDTLEGGTGSDTYKFSGKFGKDSIDESTAMGGNEEGTILINNIAIAPTGEMVGQYASGNGSLYTFKAKINGQAYTYTLKTSETSGDQLVIAKTGDVANTITLNHVNREALFSEKGYLGVKLATTPKVLLRSSLGPNPLEDATLNPATVSGSSAVTEHGGELLALYLNRPAKAGDTITLSLSDLKDKFKAILGDVTVPADGAVITLSEGQTMVPIALVQEGAEVDASGAALITATYQGQPMPELAQAQAQVAVSNAWGIELSDVSDTTTIKNGDQRPPIKGLGATDQVTVSNYFQADSLQDGAPADSKIDQIVFDSGEVWDQAKISAVIAAGGSTGPGNPPPSSYTYAYVLPDQNADYSLSGNGAYIFKGNSKANKLTGNDGANVINGAAGNDTLTGGKGGDTYFMEAGTGQDTIVENDSTSNVSDLLQWGSNVRHDQIWLRKAGTNLEVSVIGTSDKAIVKDWYVGPSRRVEQIWANGKVLTDAKVQSLVDAMAAFSPPSAGQTTLPAGYQIALNPVIAANWQ